MNTHKTASSGICLLLLLLVCVLALFVSSGSCATAHPKYPAKKSTVVTNEQKVLLIQLLQTQGYHLHTTKGKSLEWVIRKDKKNNNKINKKKKNVDSNKKEKKSSSSTTVKTLSERIDTEPLIKAFVGKNYSATANACKNCRMAVASIKIVMPFSILVDSTTACQSVGLCTVTPVVAVEQLVE